MLQYSILFTLNFQLLSNAKRKHKIDRNSNTNPNLKGLNPNPTII